MGDYSLGGGTVSSPSNSQQLQRAESPGHSNVFQLLARREISPQTRCSSKRLWGEVSKYCLDSFSLANEAGTDARSGLISWVESDSLQHLSAKYCPLLPPPRSTIAAAFSSDGKKLASTHGDHTVKIIDCQTGRCLKVLNGHRRTPWVVRFHPFCQEIVASGSLDHEVRLWNANTGECIGSRDFGRPIASIAFHAQGELLAVASGHKLYIWQYRRRGEASSPAIIMKTRRSLRAVHFHPLAAPFILTAEVNDLDSSDSSMTLATSVGYSHYPPPTVYLADAHTSEDSDLADELPLMSSPFLIWPSFARDRGIISLQHTDESDGSTITQERSDRSASVRLLTYSTPAGQYELLLSPIEPYSSSGLEEAGNNPSSTEMEIEVPHSARNYSETMEVHQEGRGAQFFPFGEPNGWELPFLQGWLIGHTQAGHRAIHPVNDGDEIRNTAQAASSANNNVRAAGGFGSRLHSSRSHITSSGGSNEDAHSTGHDGSQPQSVGRIQSELATSLAQAAAAELPCTVKLRIWSHDVRNPCAPLDAERCRLTIQHAVLCSEMGAHFSPCGRFLAACVACLLPQLEADPGLHSQANHDVIGAATSPTRHPVSARRVIYELRIYSLEEATFGLVLASRAIRAAHFLTSIQFSPTSEHLLLAYGRRHTSLLKSIVIDGETTMPIYTILEIYRVSDMELVRAITNAEDEVNVACFHPSPGGGLVYGTKEGKLRVLQYDSAHDMNLIPPGYHDQSMFEVPVYPLEC